MNWLKKATNPLDPHLRAGGYEILPVAQIFRLPSNVWCLATISRNHLVPEPLASWATNAFYSLGFLREPDTWEHDTTFLYYGPNYPFLRPDHFTQRLTQDQAQEIIAQVIQNAKRINSEGRNFYYDWIGIFGSVLRGSKTPADVDVVYSARWSDGTPLPESSYYPFGQNEPTDLAARALRTGCPRSAVSPHYHLEVKSIGTPFKVIWTMDKGLVTRKVTFPKPTKSQEADTKRELSQSDAFADDVRARCAALSSLPPPENPVIPHDTEQLTRSQWAKILESAHPVADLAHSHCLPPGDLKAKVAKLVEERFAKYPKEKTKAEKILYPYLAASTRYATHWKWATEVGLRKRKRGES
jgi:hypothetical protein